MKRNKWPVIFATPFLTAYGLFMLFPMLYSFYLSLFEYNGIVEKHFVGPLTARPTCVRPNC